MIVRYDDIKSKGCMGEWCLQRQADVDFPMQDGPELGAANHCAALVLEGCATKRLGIPPSPPWLSSPVRLSLQASVYKVRDRGYLHHNCLGIGRAFINILSTYLPSCKDDPYSQTRLQMDP